MPEKKQKESSRETKRAVFLFGFFFSAEDSKARRIIVRDARLFAYRCVAGILSTSRFEIVLARGRNKLYRLKLNLVVVSFMNKRDVSDGTARFVNINLPFF